MKHIKKMKIDIDKKSLETVSSVQYDSNTRFLHISLVNNSLPLDLTGCSVKISAIKPDDTAIFNSCTIIDTKQGFVEAELTEQINAAQGNVKCELKIYSETGVLTTKTFDIEVTASITASKAITSKNEFKALTDALKVVQGIDNKADKEKVEEKFGEVYEQLDNTVRKKDYIVYIDDYKNLVNDEDWTLAFEKATENIKSNNGGNIILGNRTYLVDKLILSKGTSIEGNGLLSEIKQNADADYPLVSLEDTSTKFITLKNFTLNGNRYSKSNNNNVLEIITDDEPAYEYGTGDIHVLVDNIFIKNASNIGLYVKGRGENIFKNIKITYSKSHGLYCKSYDSCFENISIGVVSGHGFYFDNCEALRIANCKAWMSGYENSNDECCGYYIAGSQKLNMVNCEAQSNKNHGFKIFKTTKSNVSDLQAYDNGGTTDDASGITLADVSFCNINGVSSNSNYNIHNQKYGINIIENCIQNIIELICKHNNLSELLDKNSQIDNNIVNILGDNRISSMNIGKLLLGVGSPSKLSRLYIKTDDSFTYGHYLNKTTEKNGNNNVARYDVKNNNSKKSAFYEIFINPDTNEVTLHADDTINVNANLKIIDSRWNEKHLIMGHYHFWVDSQQRLRLKNGVPTHETDGVVVGSD